jgi:hypothetical protein
MHLCFVVDMIHFALYLQGWGDGNGANNIQYLKEDCLDWLQKRRPDSIEPSDLEILLSEFVNDFFHTIAEDGSTMEVAVQICNLYRQCAAGDLSFAQHILSLPEQSSAKRSQAGEEPAELNDDMSDDEEEDLRGAAGATFPVTMGAISEDGGMEDGGMEAPPLEPVDSEWTTVKKTGKRR